MTRTTQEAGPQSSHRDSIDTASEAPRSVSPGHPQDDCQISVVVPLFNEESNVEPLCQRLERVLGQLSLSWEVILVDDGSNDATRAKIDELLARHQNLRALRFRRNFGQTAALAAGFEHARGRVVVTLDGDLQNPPEEIPKLLAKLDEGYDMVSGWRHNRKDSFLWRVLPSRVANRIIGWITGTRLHDYGCSLKAYRRDILEGILTHGVHGDMHRFLPAIAGALGARIGEIPVHHEPRRNGKSRYGLFRPLIVLVDMITIRFLLPYSFKPLKIFGLFGVGLLGIGGAINVYLAYFRLFGNRGLAERPLLLLGVLLMIMGVQLVVLGILAELQVRALLGTARRPYALLERRGFPPAKARDVGATPSTLGTNVPGVRVKPEEISK